MMSQLVIGELGLEREGYVITPRFPVLLSIWLEPMHPGRLKIRLAQTAKITPPMRMEIDSIRVTLTDPLLPEEIRGRCVITDLGVGPVVVPAKVELKIEPSEEPWELEIKVPVAEKWCLEEV